MIPYPKFLEKSRKICEGERLTVVMVSDASLSVTLVSDEDGVDKSNIQLRCGMTLESVPDKNNILIALLLSSDSPLKDLRRNSPSSEAVWRWRFKIRRRCFEIGAVPGTYQFQWSWPYQCH